MMKDLCHYLLKVHHLRRTSKTRRRKKTNELVMRVLLRLARGENVEKYTHIFVLNISMSSIFYKRIEIKRSTYEQKILNCNLKNHIKFSTCVKIQDEKWARSKGVIA